MTPKRYFYHEGSDSVFTAYTKTWDGPLDELSKNEHRIVTRERRRINWRGAILDGSVCIYPRGMKLHHGRPL